MIIEKKYYKNENDLTEEKEKAIIHRHDRYMLWISQFKQYNLYEKELDDLAWELANNFEIRKNFVDFIDYIKTKGFIIVNKNIQKTT